MYKLEKIVQVIILIAFVLVLVRACTSQLFGSVDVYKVIEAIEIVESNGNPNAINESENAFGALQIREIMIDDYNRITNQNFPHDIAYNRAFAWLVAREIFYHYMQGIENPTAKHLAFIWNGGGSAWKRVDNPKNDQKQKNLDLYWEKVKLHL
jgi:hypothetical protein